MSQLVARFDGANGGQTRTEVHLERNASAYGRCHLFEVRVSEFGGFETFRAFVSWNSITGHLEFKRVFCDSSFGEGEPLDPFSVDLELFVKYGEDVSFAVAWILLYYVGASTIKMHPKWYLDKDTRNGIEYLCKMTRHKYERLKSTIIGFKQAAKGEYAHIARGRRGTNPFSALCEE